MLHQKIIWPILSHFALRCQGAEKGGECPNCRIVNHVGQSYTVTSELSDVIQTLFLYAHQKYQTGCRKTALTRGFGGKDSVKENRQGFLSRRYHKISELV